MSTMSIMSIIFDMYDSVRHMLGFFGLSSSMDDLREGVQNGMIIELFESLYDHASHIIS
jgi:hypothetical protein